MGGDDFEGNDKVTLFLLKKDLEHLIDLNKAENTKLSNIAQAIYGDGDRPGLAIRMAIIEGRLQTVWSSLGVIGAAAIVALINALINLFKGH